MHRDMEACRTFPLSDSDTKCTPREGRLRRGPGGVMHQCDSEGASAYSLTRRPGGGGASVP